MKLLLRWLKVPNYQKMLKKEIKKLTIESNKTIFDAINKLENNQKKFLIVTEKEKVIGNLVNNICNKLTSGNNFRGLKKWNY